MEIPTSLLTGDWHALLPHPFSYIALSLVSIICGAIVGIERERKQKSAGLRTMTLICLGSTIFTFISLLLPGQGGDQGRVAAQIVNGIGFLGAGAILRGIYGVRGMTTAATIWAVAAMGMVVGIGYALAGLALAFAIVLVLISGKILDDRYFGRCRFVEAAVIYDSHNGKTGIRLESLLDDYQVARTSRITTPLSGGMVELRLKYCNMHRHHRELMNQLVELDYVSEVHADASRKSLK